MDKERAKEFIFFEPLEEIIYISKDVYKLIELNEDSLGNIYAVVDTESGEKLFEMDFAYSGEPIIMRVFLHKEFFMKRFWNRPIRNV